MVATTNEVDDFEHVAVGQRGLGQRRARHDHAVALDRDLVRFQLELLHERGDGGGGGAARGAVDGEGAGRGHHPRDSGCYAPRKPRTLSKWAKATSETPMIVSTASSAPCGTASAPPMNDSPVIAVTNGARRP